MGSRHAFSIGEWYHCYNRGVDKRTVFENAEDYERFLGILYLANSIIPIHRSSLLHPTLKEVLDVRRESPIVSVAAFCLMPNHYHLLLKETTEGGITSFMRKMGTAYTMYFNIKNQRVGNLLVRPFRSKHISTDDYFQRCVRYIHCNPAELYEPEWKMGKVKHLPSLINKLRTYPYSSLGVYESEYHMLRPVVDTGVFDIVADGDATTIARDAFAYYAQFQP